MEQYIPKSVVLGEIERRIKRFREEKDSVSIVKTNAYKGIFSFINTLEVKEVNEVPATVMVNKYGNRFISSWSGLKEYDGLKKGEEIKILIPKK